MNFKEYLKSNIVFLDGGMGTLLQANGLEVGEFPETWNITHPDIVTKIHKSYFDAGSNVVSTNTFGANSLKFKYDELKKIIKAAVDNAKTAKSLTDNNSEKYIALDIGPTGKLLKPLGQLSFDDAVEVFSTTVKIGVECGVDLIFIETMNDSYETKAAVLAAKENSDLPIIVSNAYGDDGKLMTGATPSAMVAMLEGLGVDALGANCSLGPVQLQKVVTELIENASVPVLVKPNAGMPRTIDNATVFDISPEEFAFEISKMVNNGVRLIGGCCGTTPEYIKKVFELNNNVVPKPVNIKNFTVVSSYTHSVRFGVEPVLIGERINPTGKKRFKQALVENDMDYILGEGVSQQEKGVHILDVNVGLPEIDEPKMLTDAVRELQAIIDLPLQIDSSNYIAIENAMRYYNGKPMINSVNGKVESMNAIFSLVKKYGGVVVALTLDESGIPDTVDERVKIANKIIDTAKSYGISKKDIIFDTLAMAVSAKADSALATLGALNRIKNDLGCHTILGVSNVSFGLPKRDVVNSTFFTLALENGLSAAIMNPYSQEIMKAYYSYRVLKGLDSNCEDYIDASVQFSDNISDLHTAIVKGLKDRASEITFSMLTSVAPLDIINTEIIPALDFVGKGFENKTVYLPQLLMSAEAAKAAFEQIKTVLGSNVNEKSECIILATVKGDIHDIGKNIVKLLLENYGYNVIDLGKDVEPDDVVKAVGKYNAKIVGLSALMTTTVPAMETTIKKIKGLYPKCQVIVGGAVLTAEYADAIGADRYASDAMDAVRYAKEIL